MDRQCTKIGKGYFMLYTTVVGSIILFSINILLIVNVFSDPCYVPRIYDVGLHISGIDENGTIIVTKFCDGMDCNDDICGIYDIRAVKDIILEPFHDSCKGDYIYIYSYAGLILPAITLMILSLIAHGLAIDLYYKSRDKEMKGSTLKVLMFGVALIIIPSIILLINTNTQQCEVPSYLSQNLKMFYVNGTEFTREYDGVITDESLCSFLTVTGKIGIRKESTPIWILDNITCKHIILQHNASFRIITAIVSIVGITFTLYVPLFHIFIIVFCFCYCFVKPQCEANHN